ncbi:transcription termination factor MTERF8, chloroplastic-like [Cannabis sativa]|uniref:transcription termination factor MTERF8, chloroplastic-like n=1 Tax=Cannabis sativa TaxID=3483 RepID=UPI0029C9CB0E|nr:transcription termination factor MTERF8, chloroplastic-like [Cannabis sativa]
MLRRLLCNKLTLIDSRLSPSTHGFHLFNYFLRPMSEIPNSADPQNFTASYLQNSCGFTRNSAISISKKLNIGNPERADSNLELFRAHGLTQTHIKKIIATRPALLLADLEDKLRLNMKLLESLGLSGARLGKLLCKEPRLLLSDMVDSVDFFRARGFSNKQISVLAMKRPTVLLFNVNDILKPKLDFFKSKGFTDGDVAKLLSFEPYILGRSLENHIIPSFQILSRVFSTDEEIVKVVKAGHWILEYNLEKTFEKNLLILKSHGVPDPIILRMFTIHSRTLLLNPPKVMEILDEVVKLGFDPNTVHFALAFRSMAVISKKLWEQKMKVYKSFGLSEDQVYSAFKIQPMCMLTSEKKIIKLMNFFINKLNIEPSLICKNPSILILSLEKRIIPRSLVLQLLISTGFLKEGIKFISYFKMTEKYFVEKVVKKHQHVLPDIVKVYESKKDFQVFPIISKA